MEVATGEVRKVAHEASKLEHVR